MPGYHEYELVDRTVSKNKQTPIVLMTEHDFNPEIVEDFGGYLESKGHVNCKLIPTGINTQFKDDEGKVKDLQSQGLFIDETQAQFNKQDITAKENVFNNDLPLTKDTILKNQSVKDYINTTTTSVNYSHDNAKRVIAIHAMQSKSDKNVDLIMMGEHAKNDKKELLARSDYLLNTKGFSQVIYHELGHEPEVLAKSDNSGPIYRVIHTGRVSPQEARNLRNIGNHLGGGTGDQSFAEAITSSDIVIYETFTHKKDLVNGMRFIADSIDSTGKLSTTIELLAYAKNEDQFIKLDALLKDPYIQEKFVDWRKEILKNNLSEKLPKIVDEFMEEVKNNNEKPSEDSQIEQSQSDENDQNEVTVSEQELQSEVTPLKPSDTDEQKSDEDKTGFFQKLNDSVKKLFSSASGMTQPEVIENEQEVSTIANNTNLTEGSSTLRMYQAMGGTKETLLKNIESSKQEKKQQVVSNEAEHNVERKSEVQLKTTMVKSPVTEAPPTIRPR